MSRTPIRLALERLAHVGLIDATAIGGFTVREFTLSEVRDAIEVQGAWTMTPSNKVLIEAGFQTFRYQPIFGFPPPDGITNLIPTGRTIRDKS